MNRWAEVFEALNNYKRDALATGKYHAAAVFESAIDQWDGRLKGLYVQDVKKTVESMVAEQNALAEKAELAEEDKAHRNVSELFELFLAEA